MQNNLIKSHNSQGTKLLQQKNKKNLEPFINCLLLHNLNQRTILGIAQNDYR